ncbi:MAG: gamma-glutamylcyclotransferase [Chloroflexi bacterium]|nr:gamma-glutamylcyclotransferase [Chloroflexota bacterium]
MNYFAYATDLNKQHMQQRCPGAKPVSTAVLPNYRLIFAGWSRQWRGAVASIKPWKGERVRGALYEITEQCLRRLDSAEGYPVNYEHLNITVFDEDDTPIPAITFVKAGKLEESTPSREYLAVIQQGLRDWRLF